MLWYLLLDFAQLFSHDAILLPIVHGACACAAIWLVARYAPFARWLRLLIAASYFMLFEYFALARGYVLIELLAFASCAELRGRRRGWVLAALLALLAQSELQGAVLGAGLCAAWILLEKRAAAAASSKRFANLKLGLSSYALSAAFCLFEVHRRAQLTPEAESVFVAVPARPTIFEELCLIRRTLVPILVNFDIHDWLDARVALTVVSSCALLAALTWSLRESPVGLACWTVSAGLLLIVSRLAPLTLRHYGMLFIAFVAASWLAAPTSAVDPPANPMPALEQRLLAGFLAVFFAAQAVAGVDAFTDDLLHPLSAARATARYLKHEQLLDLPIVCDIDYAATSVVALLDRPCFFPSIQAESRFTTWGPQRRAVGPAELQSAVGSFLQRGPSVLLLLNHPLEPPIPGASTLLASFLQADRRFRALLPLPGNRDPMSRAR